MELNKTPEGRLITVSNRLPIVVAREPGGEWRIEAGAGGLITALDPVLRNRRGLWIGWSGTVEEDGVDIDKLLWRATGDIGYADEGVKGYTPTTYTYETYDEAKAAAKLWNELAGLSLERSAAIVLSTMSFGGR